MNTTFAVLFWFLKSVDAIWRDLQDSVNVRENLLPERFFCKTIATFHYNTLVGSLLFKNPDDESASLPVTKLTILPSVGDSESDRIPFFVVNVMYSMKKE